MKTGGEDNLFDNRGDLLIFGVIKNILKKQTKHITYNEFFVLLVEHKIIGPSYL
ncbi:hypothetical protein [Pelotomaculum sp. FP]|uniref:hypothetical protein n=1 Tax=Pelotomaculum sp. FP TaxID=261474 RepID=UPI001863E773|nr:hypothetical protein [Pelotomaculum sp. FP]